MIQIIASDEQAQLIAKATEPITIVDRGGNVLGHVKRSLFTKEELDEAERLIGSEGPWRTTQQVLDHLNSLEQ